MMSEETPRLDLLLYCHDGRGQGHSSRTIAIGLALRRLSSYLRLLIVSGAKDMPQLIANCSLDWMKLPSYQSSILNGKSVGASGVSNFSSDEIASLRQSFLGDIVKRLRPRCVLVDHLPEGKKNELTDALEISKTMNTRWILGVRAVVGDVEEMWSKNSQEAFRKYYSDILWYGDLKLHSYENMEKIADHFGILPVKLGLVSRALEVCRVQNCYCDDSKKLDGTIGISWCSHSTVELIKYLVQALHKSNTVNQKWHSYIGQALVGVEREKIIEPLIKSPIFNVYEFSNDYLWTLKQSRLAVVYGGYNSITDILWAGLPSIIIARQMQDGEQAVHARYIESFFSPSIHIYEEAEICAEVLANSLKKLSAAPPPTVPPNMLEGAEKAALYLLSVIEKIGD
jgi:predicted glycosyltransferase